MTDREIVIQHFQDAIEASGNGTKWRFVRLDIIEKAISLLNEQDALLKEQEAVDPINSYGTFRCGNCRNIVGYKDGHGRGYQNNFCSKCGKMVKWDA